MVRYVEHPVVVPFQLVCQNLESEAFAYDVVHEGFVLFKELRILLELSVQTVYALLRHTMVIRHLKRLVPKRQSNAVMSVLQSCCFVHRLHELFIFLRQRFLVIVVALLENSIILLDK